MPPDLFTERVRDFMRRARHRSLGLPLRKTVYQPMLELLDELRRRQFTIFIVTGGGAEFLRAISDQFYGVPAEAMVGTAIEYEFGAMRTAGPCCGGRRASPVL